MSFSAGSPIGLGKSSMSREMSGSGAFEESGPFSPAAAGAASQGARPVKEESPDELLTAQLTEQLSEAFLGGMLSSKAAASSDSTSPPADLFPPASSTSGESPREKGEAWRLSSMLEHNHQFTQKRSYEPFLTGKLPDKKLVVVTCMDCRLTELLPAALGLKNGDAKIIKVAGAIVAHPFGSVMRSILVAVYGLGAEHIIVVGHHDCGMTGLDPAKILTQAKAHGIPAATFKTLASAGLNLDGWLSGFSSVQTSVQHSVDTIRNHPLLHCVKPDGGSHSRKTSEVAPAPAQQQEASKPPITVTGFVICTTTGRLDLVTEASPEIEDLLQRHKAAREATQTPAADAKQ